MFKRAGWQAGLAVAFVVAGFTVMGVAWRGSAKIDFVQGQVPYLLSGGFVGLGLVVLGVGVMLFEAGRRVSSTMERRMTELSEAVSKLNGSSNGLANAARVLSADTVVVGSESFHSPGCRLVDGKEALVYAARDLAEESGLVACRVCNP